MTYRWIWNQFLLRLYPNGIAFDSRGIAYITDNGLHVVRIFNPATGMIIWMKSVDQLNYVP